MRKALSFRFIHVRSAAAVQTRNKGVIRTKIVIAFYFQVFSFSITGSEREIPWRNIYSIFVLCLLFTHRRFYNCFCQLRKEEEEALSVFLSKLVNVVGGKLANLSVWDPLKLQQELLCFETLKLILEHKSESQFSGLFLSGFTKALRWIWWVIASRNQLRMVNKNVLRWVLAPHFATFMAPFHLYLFILGSSLARQQNCL